MSYSNFHTHCSYCDGLGQPEEYVRQAIQYGFAAIGFSSHAPLPDSYCWTLKDAELKEYCHTVRSLGVKYSKAIQVYLGLEIDYIPGTVGKNSDEFRACNLDYTIGSVHFAVDDQTGRYFNWVESEDSYIWILKHVFRGDIRAFVGGYYKSMPNMVREKKPDIIGHFDIIKKNNLSGNYFCEGDDWYKQEVRDTLKEIALSGCIVEASTAGMARGCMNDLYPSMWILRECRERNIPIILNSDAHTPKELNANFELAVKRLNAVGYFEQSVLSDGTWKQVELTAAGAKSGQTGQNH
ncbi:histidinol-phosphatase [Peptococcaceae bacterium CEB3]|nr:histidinol-phosphatase [Peptococcaceae bacterium CEB3]